MSSTTGVVLVVLIIAIMTVVALAVLVFGAVRALETRRPHRGSSYEAPPPVAHHPMFDRDRDRDGR
ncbi:hypothetical protein [Nocardiopsis synnemataformans]|uniref:hypothetical protein n=1 Tax=Nocardiopsis synnemataformans TaxID=61305 RepID=UPI003EB84FCB